MRKVVAEDLTADAPQRVKTSLLVLENYNRFGIEVRFRRDSKPHFLSWAAVLRIDGIDQEAAEDAEEALREREQPEPTEKADPPRNHQELMDRLASARTPSEVADVKTAADSLATGQFEKNG